MSKNEIKDAENPRGLEKDLIDRGLTDTQIKDVAKAFRTEVKDLNKLNNKAKRVIRQVIENFDFNNQELVESPAEIASLPSGKKQKHSKTMNEIKFFLKGVQRLSYSAWVKIQDLSYKSPPHLRKYFEKVEDVFSRLDLRTNMNRGMGTKEYKDLNNYIKKNKPELAEDLVWADVYLMNDVISVVEGRRKVSSDMLKKYKEIYDTHIESFENVGREGTVENIAYGKMRVMLDRIFTEFTGHILKANEPLKKLKPKEYQALKDFLSKKLYVENYLPHYTTKKAKLMWEDSIDFDKKIDEIAEKIIKQKAETDTDKVLVKKLKLEGKSLAFKRRNYNEYKELYEKNLEKQNTDEKLARAREDAVTSLENGQYASELTIQSSELFARDNRMPLFIKSKETGEIVRTTEGKLYNVFNTYILSSARFNAIAEASPEYLHKNF